MSKKLHIDFDEFGVGTWRFVHVGVALLGLTTEGFRYLLFVSIIWIKTQYLIIVGGSILNRVSCE